MLVRDVSASLLSWLRFPPAPGRLKCFVIIGMAGRSVQVARNGGQDNNPIRTLE